MAILVQPYEGVKSCSEDIQPGVIGAVRYLLDAYPEGKVEGIVAECLDYTSVRAGGRGIKFYTGELPDWASPLAEFLYQYSKDLGVQCVIWNSKIWSCGKSDKKWRPYTGSIRHTNYILIELTTGMASKSAEEVYAIWTYVAKNASPVTPTSVDSSMFPIDEDLEWS